MRKNKQPLNPRRARQLNAKAPVFSYYSNRSPETTTSNRTPSSSKKSTNKLSKLQLLPSLLAMLAVIISLGYMLTIDTKPRLSLATVQADSLLQADEVYQQALEKLIRGSLFNRSKLLINTQSLENRLQKDFPELSDVTITIPLTNRRPILAIQGAIPVLVLKTTSGQYVLDGTGKVVLESSRVRAEIIAKLPVVQDDSDLRVHLGETALPAVDTQFIREVTHQLTEKNLSIENLTLPAVANQLEVKLTGEGYFIKFDTKGDARLQAGTYLATIDKLVREGKKPVEYIDVRVEEKAFYR